MTPRYKVGFTVGAFDLFHIGHLNLLKRAKEYCDFLIVGVNTDAFVLQYKNIVPVIAFEERITIIKSIRYVDLAVSQDSAEEGKLTVWRKYQYEVLITGDDWKGTEVWSRIETLLQPLGVDILYLPYTHGVSTSIIRKLLEKRIDGCV